MKTLTSLLFTSLAFVSSAYAEIKPGDLIFHTSLSSQSQALQLAMKSPYSHMGIVLFQEGKPYVFEASNVVKFTPLKEWINRGKNRHYRLKRLKDQSLLTASSVKKLMQAAKTYAGKPYDLFFEWSDKKIYCSELVWKMYHQALGVKIGKIQTFKDFDFSHPEVKAKLKERFGNKIPFSEKVISPAAMFNSDLLIDANR